MEIKMIRPRIYTKHYIYDKDNKSYLSKIKFPKCIFSIDSVFGGKEYSGNPIGKWIDYYLCKILTKRNITFIEFIYHINWDSNIAIYQGSRIYTK